MNIPPPPKPRPRPPKPVRRAAKPGSDPHTSRPGGAIAPENPAKHKPLFARRPPPKAHLPPGTEIEAMCTVAVVHQLDWWKDEKRWEACLTFTGYWDNEVISLKMHLNLGSASEPAPSLARNARYARAFAVVAGHWPREGEDLSPAIFEGWWGRIRVADVGKKSPAAEKYSVVSELVGPA